MDVSNASGLFEIDSQGMSGIFKVDGLIINVPKVEFDLNAALFEINTRPTEYNGTANLGDASEIVSLEAGPYFRSVLLGAEMKLTGLNASLFGNFLFESSSSLTTISMTELSASVDVNGQGATLSDGTGVLIINASGVAGSVSGDMKVNAGPLQSGGQIMISINNCLLYTSPSPRAS